MSPLHRSWLADEADQAHEGPQTAEDWGTLARPYIAQRLGWYDEACRHADALLAMCRKHGAAMPAYDAIFAGYWALTQEANYHLDALREQGALLFAWRGSRALQSINQRRAERQEAT